MEVTPIKARCRRCGEDFYLYEVLDQHRGTCPRCGWILTPHRTAKLLEEAALADIAQRRLVGALHNLRNLPGNVRLRPHTVLRNLFEEVGWHDDLADDPELLSHELQELQRLLGAWELLDPHVAAAQPRRTWFQRATDWMRGGPEEPMVASAVAPPRPHDDELDPQNINDRDARAQQVSKVSTAS
jgi:ribosomal protein L37E